MMKHVLVLGLVCSGTLIAMSAPANAQIPLIQNGRPVFTPAYLSKDGPQPFSTRRTRELAAARSQGGTNRVYSGTVYRQRRTTGFPSPTRRPLFFSRRGRFR